MFGFSSVDFGTVLDFSRLFYVVDIVVAIMSFVIAVADFVLRWVDALFLHDGWRRDLAA